MLCFDPGLEVYAQEDREIPVGDILEELRLPAEPCGSDGEASDRMTRVVLAVAEAPLTVLPRFPPVDGREADEDRAIRELRSHRQPRRLRQLGPKLERVRERRVVVDRRPRVQAIDRTGDQIALRSDADCRSTD